MSVDTIEVEGRLPPPASATRRAAARSSSAARDRGRADDDGLRQDDSRAARAARVSASASTDADVADAARLLSDRAEETAASTRGIELALERVLVEPEFLFRVERDPAEPRAGHARIASATSSSPRACRSSCGAASRTTSCSTLAARGKLQRSGGARAAGAPDARRSAQSSALVSNFAGQWLYLREPRRRHVPIRICSPISTTTCARRSSARPSCSSRASSARTAASLDLLTADYTFVNERLARHYGIPNVYGSHFRRVDAARRPTRRGLLGQGSILTVTSYAEPHLAGRPRQMDPREHPRHAAAAAAAERAAAQGEQRSGAAPAVGARAAWSSTATNPVCASCHALMDPLGFALENFDAIGQWRSTEANGADRRVRHACPTARASPVRPSSAAALLRTASSSSRRSPRS